MTQWYPRYDMALYRGTVYFVITCNVFHKVVTILSKSQCLSVAMACRRERRQPSHGSMRIYRQINRD